jgi:hypothetical protein
MAEHLASRSHFAGDGAQSRSGLRLVLMVVAIAWFVGVLFATESWNAEAKDSGASLDVNVSAVGGLLPKVVVTSKEVIVGTRQAAIEAPTTDLK